jgi:hypothetical protein
MTKPDFNSPTPGSGQQKSNSSTARDEPRSRSANDASLVNIENHEPASEQIAPTLADVLNEFEYVCREAPDEASRLQSRRGVELLVAALVDTARKEGHRSGFRAAEGAYFDE